jgi:hypothetical protein
MACRRLAGEDVKICRASPSHCPIAVPATAMRPSVGNTGQARLVPAMTANQAPSRITSMAAAVAARASAILVCGYSIDPEQSMMMISELPVWPPAGPVPENPVASAADVTVTMTLTSRPPTVKNWFWSMSMVKPDSVMARFSSVTSPS